VAVAASAHRVLKILSPDESSTVHAGELRTLVRVNQYTFLRVTSPNRHVQRLQHHIGGLAGLLRLKHDSAILGTLAMADRINIRSLSISATFRLTASEARRPAP